MTLSIKDNLILTLGLSFLCSATGSFLSVVSRFTPMYQDPELPFLWNPEEPFSLQVLVPYLVTISATPTTFDHFIINHLSPSYSGHWCLLLSLLQQLCTTQSSYGIIEQTTICVV